jgi:DNA-binding PucR family transcriptional regulator
VKDAWAPPSAHVAELLRRAARQAMTKPDVADAVNKRMADAAGQSITDDPALAAALQATNSANVMHWLSRTVVDPGSPVAPARSRQGVAFAIDLVRRGKDSTALSLYLMGQNAAWQSWMPYCFAETDDPNELRELLDVSARSIFTFIEDTIADLSEVMRGERARLLQGSDADRLAIVAMVLDGRQTNVDVVGARLGHDLRRQQTAAILWHDPSVAHPADLERVALSAGLAAHVGRPLTISASSSSLWAWYVSTEPPETRALASAVARFPGVRMALGGTGLGLEGFRSSHTDAVTTQQLMARSRASQAVATYDDVSVASLVASDDERARAFARRTLGNLATADPVLCTTLSVYLRGDASAARAARVLYTHRNTVLNRIARAEQLLPTPLEGHGLAIGLALEIVQWLGTEPAAP